MMLCWEKPTCHPCWTILVFLSAYYLSWKFPAWGHGFWGGSEGTCVPGRYLQAPTGPSHTAGEEKSNIAVCIPAISFLESI